MNVMIPSTSQSRALSMSPFLVLAKQMISASNPSLAIALTAADSLSETIGNPASI